MTTPTFDSDGDFFPEQPTEVTTYGGTGSWKRDREAARLKAIGWSLEEIAEHFQLTDRATGEIDTNRAARSVRRGLTAVSKFSTDEMRLEQLHTLEEMKRKLWKDLDKDNILVQQGRVILHDGTPVEDRRLTLEIMDRILKIEERQAKLMGLDATTRLSIEADQIGGEIISLIQMLNDPGPVDAAPTLLQLESGESA